jgi:excisionase family DNA binding protein
MTVKNAAFLAMLLRPEETGQLLGISRAKTYGMIASGELPAIRCGKAIRVPRDSLLKWIEANTTGGEVRRSA